MMKKICLSLVLAMSSWSLCAQYIPNNSQGYQFMTVFNPAFTGVENFNDLKLSYRYQWSGFGKNAPKFINLTYSKRIKHPLDMTYNAQRTSNYTGNGMEQLPRSKRMIHGLGANLFQSSIGVLQSIGGGVSYAFNYPLSRHARLAFGVSALIENRKLDIAEVSVREPDDYYNYLLRGSTSQTDINLRAGVLYYRERFYFGLSYFPLLNIAMESSDLSMDEMFYRGSAQAGIAMPLSADVTIKPSVLAVLQMNNDLVVDYSAKAFIQNKVCIGLTYRDIKSGVALLGFNINEMFSATYSFELSVGEFRKFDDGSHEIVLAARLNNLKRFTQYIW